MFKKSDTTHEIYIADPYGYYQTHNRNPNNFFEKTTTSYYERRKKDIQKAVRLLFHPYLLAAKRATRKTFRGGVRVYSQVGDQIFTALLISHRNQIPKDLRRLIVNYLVDAELKDYYL